MTHHRRTFRATVLLLCTVFLWTAARLAGPAGAQDVEIRCQWWPATIVGTNGDDVLRGTPGRDVIHGLGGNDVIEGLGGNDRVCGGDGRDRLLGGDGVDALYGGAGRDVIRGGAGDDALFGGSAGDRLHGGPGRDDLAGGPGRDVLRGGRHIDTLDGGAGVDRCAGNSGLDFMNETCEAVSVDVSVQQVEVDGLRVRFFAAEPVIPVEPTTLTINAVIREYDDEPRLCLQHRPTINMVPQCTGPTIDGLGFDSNWVELAASGERWGWRLVTVTWPPVDGRVDLLRERRELISRTTFALGELTPPGLPAGDARPAHCADFVQRTSATTRDYLEWAEANPEQFAAVRIARGGQTRLSVLRMKGDPDPVQAEFAARGLTACIEVVDHNAADLETAERQLRSLGYRPGPRGSAHPNVVLGLFFIDQATVDELVATLDRPDLVSLAVNGVMG